MKAGLGLPNNDVESRFAARRAEILDGERFLYCGPFL
jgi:hypothetical protein